MTGRSPVEPDPFARWGKEERKRPARRGRSEGRTPMPKEGRGGWRLGATVGEEGRARLRSGRGGRPGELR